MSSAFLRQPLHNESLDAFVRAVATCSWGCTLEDLHFPAAGKSKYCSLSRTLSRSGNLEMAVAISITSTEWQREFPSKRSSTHSEA